MLDLGGMQSTPSLASLPDPLSPGVVALDRVQSMSTIKLNPLTDANRIVWNRKVYWYKNGFGIR